jgi:hypothetical protein
MRRWEDSIIKDLQERGSEGMHWIYLVRIFTSGGLLYTETYTVGFHKMQGIS